MIGSGRWVFTERPQPDSLIAGANRRAGLVERRSDGGFVISNDHLGLAAAYEAQLLSRGPVGARVVSYWTLAEQIESLGPTHFDHILAGETEAPRGDGALLREKNGAGPARPTQPKAPVPSGHLQVQGSRDKVSSSQESAAPFPKITHSPSHHVDQRLVEFIIDDIGRGRPPKRLRERAIIDNGERLLDVGEAARRLDLSKSTLIRCVALAAVRGSSGRWPERFGMTPQILKLSQTLVGASRRPTPPSLR